MKKLLLAGGIMLILLVVGLTGCASALPVETPKPTNINLNSQPQGIWVNGQGKVTVTPDIAVVSLGISAQSTSVAQAQSQAADAMTKVMNALTGNGIAQKDIQTQRYSIQQVTRWDQDKQQETVIGYRVTNMVTAKIRALDKTGAIIDAVAMAGGDLTRVSGISFSVEDPNPYYDQARQKAMADAKSKAEQLASLSGVVLGRVVYINEGSASVPTPVPVAFLSSDRAAPVTPISPGEMDITLNVQVAYSIQ